MFLNPIKKSLFTESGELIKKLDCPFQIEWSSLAASKDGKSRVCSVCDHSIVDTSKLTEQELLNIIKKNPDACLKVDLNQENIRITNE
ncbi:MAG: hypothetical protein P8O16_20285 [Algoriphagus sp.]|uniref:hypothetical protein n=1 Tax=Algoriphagus sp. TaxID=1872435 RepID=UPI002625BE63|nr:hypothetical protein [Algoriphagus sp.]MDG1279620.1 hypothetical protein [Algoriphagus sp.]